MNRTVLVFCSLMLLAAGALAQSPPYAGEQERTIKALSPEELRSYLAGEGMGFAKAAELNHHPGPKHVVAMSSALKLSAEQEKQARAIFARMQQEATDLGRQIVEKEGELDGAFSAGRARESEVARLTLEIGGLLGRLRHVHLRAHLETRAILTKEQVAAYDRLRGYGAGEHQHSPEHHK